MFKYLLLSSESIILFINWSSELEFSTEFLLYCFIVVDWPTTNQQTAVMRPAESRHRKVEIQSLGRGYPDTLQVFRMPASKFWYVGMYVPARSRFVKKSTRCERLQVPRSLQKSGFSSSCCNVCKRCTIYIKVSSTEIVVVKSDMTGSSSSVQTSRFG